jgi:hypothetical protein
VANGGVSRSTAPATAASAPQTSRSSRSVASAGASAPTDLVAYVNTALGSTATAESTSPTDEPSVSLGPGGAFWTGNFYAASSTDDGRSFSFVNPSTAFPSSYGGFCCDQRTIYIPGWNLTIWALLYLPDSNNNNEVRLAVAPTNSLTSNVWTYWDFTSSLLQLPSGFGSDSFDYPQVAYSSNNLYLTANMLSPTTGNIDFSVVFRCPLSALGSPGGSVSCTNFWGQNEDTFTPIDGATSTMYWANHLSNTTLQVFSWPETVDWTGVASQPVSHSAFPDNAYTCTSPDGSDMCGPDNWTVRGGWLTSAGVLGFLWDASQGTGTLGTFPYPYVHVVEIDQGSMTLIDEPIMWSNSTAWAYSAVAVNGQGDLGATVAYSGNGSYPGSTVLVRDSISGGTWQPLNIQEGTNGPPPDVRWGDFLTVRAAGGNGLTWLAATYTLQGSCADNWGPCSSVQPRFVWFGRESNQPCLPPAAPTSGSIPPSSPHRLFLPLVVNGCAPF